MSSNDISETRFNQIKRQIGSPLDENPIDFMKRLKAATDSDNSMKQFIHQAAHEEPPTVVRPPARDLVGSLVTTDFMSIDAVTNLKHTLALGVIHDLSLAEDEKSLFIVRPDPDALTVQRDIPSQPVPLDINKGDLKIHPVFVAVSATPTSSSPAQLPAFVFPVGKLLHKDIRPIEEFGDTSVEKHPKNRPFIDTNYVVVVDPINKDRPIWLIYNRQPVDEFGDIQILDPETESRVFPQIAKNFDAAKILSSSRRWADNSYNVVITELESNIKDTMMTGAVTVKTATLEAVAATFRLAV